MTAPNLRPDVEHITVRGHRVHLSMATTFIYRLAQARDRGVPVVLQETDQALNREQTSPADLQAMLEEACDVLGMWLEQIRRPAPGREVSDP